jgi:Cytochrome c3
MSFLIRQISRSAEGREIIRPTKVEGDRLTIGRSPNCNVHLTDLAVALRHATVERAAPNRLLATAEAGLSFELDGRKVGRGPIELGTGGDIRIASHILRFMPTPAGSDEIAIDVERVTEGEVKLDRSAERVFSLASVLPSKRAGAWLFTFVVLALFLAWPIKSYYDRQERAQAAQKFHADKMWISGSLSQPHTQLEQDCTACHVKPFEAVRDQACVACHTQIHDHADPVRLARAQPDLDSWGKVRLAFQDAFDLPPGRCVDCHTEHEGPQQMPVTEQRFCSDCHGGLDAKLPDTRIDNAADFGTSHPEFKPAVLTRWNGDRPTLQRVSLADKPREMSNLKFPHAMHLSNTNGVAQMARRLAAQNGFGQALACKDCHIPTPDGIRFQPVNMEEDCGMCHSLAFDRIDGTLRTLRHGEPDQVVADLRDFYRARPLPRPSTLSEMARRRPGDVMQVRTAVQFARAQGNAGSRAERAIRGVFSRGGACYDCHTVQAPAGRSLNYRIRPVAFSMRYMHKGWFDHKPHETEDCSSCHNANASQSSGDVLLPDLASCRECHGGEAARKEVQSSCAMCHDYHMDGGQPAMLIRARVRGKKKVPTAIAGVAPTLTRTAQSLPTQKNRAR